MQLNKVNLTKKLFSQRLQSNKSNNPVIVAAVRTPIGSAWGSLGSVKGTKLGSIAVKGALEQAKINPADVNEVLFGNVLQGGQGQAPARQVAVGADLPLSVSCTTINKVCASGMKTIILAAQSIKLGDTQVVVTGGYESMSNVPYILDPKARTGLKYGDGKVIDLIVHDGLWDVYNNFHMGNCAEDCATKHKFTREEQDAYAIQSYKRTAAAVARGSFKNEIVPVEVDLGRGKTATVTEDEEYKNVNFDKIPTLKPAFVKTGGTVTAANSSTLNDGAAAVIVTSEEYANTHNIKPLARILSYADAETKPIEFTEAPSLAIPIALKRAGLTVNDIDLWEINEAFSVVALVNMKILGLNPEKVNINGGGVSLGHPIGCSGARIVTSLVHALKEQGKRYGCAAICNGGGGASAIIVERIE
jgi:acetyl-CoA C-acetyltransferase